MKKKPTHNTPSLPKVHFTPPEKYWEQLAASVQNRKQRPSNRIKYGSLYAALAIAASILLVIGLWTLLPPSTQSTKSPKEIITAQHSLETLLLNDKEFAISEEELVTILATHSSVGNSISDSEIIDYLLENNVEEQEIYDAIYSNSL